MVAVQRVSIINSFDTLLVNDYDFTKVQNWQFEGNGGVLFSDLSSRPEFNIDLSTGTISAGTAIVNVTRTGSTPIANENFFVLYKLSEDLSGLTIASGRKIYIEIEDSLLQDPTLIDDVPPSTDYANGLNVGSIKSTTSYPSHPNYLPLWEITAGPAGVDLRDYPKIDGDMVDMSNMMQNISTSGSITANNVILPDGNVQTQLDTLETLINNTESNLVSVVLGEDVQAGQIGFAGEGVIDTDVYHQLTVDGDQNMGNGTNIRLQQGFVATKNNIVRSISVRLRKIGAPVDNVILRIFASDQTTLVATATNSFSGGTITAAYVTYTYTFSDVALTEGSIYYFELSRDGGQSGVNYYQMNRNLNEAFLYYGDFYFYDGANWQWINANPYFIMQLGRNFEVDKWYVADSSFINTAKVGGIFAETKNTGENCLVTVSGANINQKALKSGTELFLNNQMYDAQLQFNTIASFGVSNITDEKAGQSFKLDRGIETDFIMLRFGRAGTPADNIVIRIETDLNNKPSGTLVDPNAQAIIGPGFLTDTYTLRFQFAGSFQLKNDVQYWIVLSRSGALDAGNFFHIGIQSTNVYPNGRLVRYNSGQWIDNGTQDMFFSFGQNFRGTEQLTPIDQQQIVGQSTGNQKGGFSFIPDQDMTIYGTMIYLTKTGTPVDNCVLRIETAATQYNNVSTGPTGTLVNVNATASVAGATVSNTANRKTAFVFPAPITLQKNVIYWIVVERSGAVDGANYYRVGYSSTANFLFGYRSINNAGVWTLPTLTFTQPRSFNFLTKYYPYSGITSYQNNVDQVRSVTTISQPLQARNHFTKIGEAVNDTGLALNRRSYTLNTQQTLSFNVIYYAPIEGTVSAYITGGGGAKVIELYFRNLAQDIVTLRDVGNTPGAQGAGINTFIPKGTYFSLLFTGSPTTSNAVFYPRN